MNRFKHIVIRNYRSDLAVFTFSLGGIATIPIYEVLHNCHIEKLVARGSLSRYDLKQLLQDSIEDFRVMLRDGRIVARRNHLEKLVHIRSSEGRIQSYHFVQDAPEGPNVTLLVVRLIPPHLG